MQFNSDVPHKFTACYTRENLCFVIIEFNLFQSIVPHFILLYFFIRILLKTNLRFI